jgi:hypothetical protein
MLNHWSISFYSTTTIKQEINFKKNMCNLWSRHAIHIAKLNSNPTPYTLNLCRRTCHPYVLLPFCNTEVSRKHHTRSLNYTLNPKPKTLNLWRRACHPYALLQSCNTIVAREREQTIASPTAPRTPSTPSCTCLKQTRKDTLCCVCVCVCTHTLTHTHTCAEHIQHPNVCV